MKHRRHEWGSDVVLGLEETEAPLPEARWSAKEAGWFVGKYVLRSFEARNPATGESMREHMWIEVARAG